MADVKATPTPPSTSSTPSNASEDKPKSGSNRKNKGNHQAPSSKDGGQDNNDHHGGDNLKIRKKPELEHYKPGAFGSRSGKPEDEDSTEPKSKGRNKRNNNQNNEQTEKVQNAPNAEQTSEKSHRNNRNRKKPDQAHYVPKKSNEGGEETKDGNRKKNKGKSKRNEQKKGTPNDKVTNDEPQRNGHVEGHEQPVNKRNKQRGSHSRDSQDPGQQHETNLPPRLRSKDDQSASGAAPGGRTDRGQPSRKGNNKRGSGSGNQRNSSPRKNLDGHHHRGQDHHRESSSPMVSNEAARSPSPGSLGQVQSRDSASSSRNNQQRRSYSPGQRRGNIVSSPTHPRGQARGSATSSYRDQRRGQGGSRRYDYHSSSRDHDWRSGSEDQYRSGQVQPVKDQGSSAKSTSSKTIMPPRFQRSRGEHHGGQSHQEWRNDHKANFEDDYEKDEDDDITDTSNRVNDWSLEVEEEEERQLKKSEKEQSGHHRGGLLRLPPDAMTTSTPNPTPNVSNSSDWRSNRDFNHYDNNNPAWRGMESRPTAGPSSSNERYLFDPRNPKKPILAQRGGRGGGSSTGVPLEQHHQRFPVGPRFVPPPTMHPGSSGGGGQPLRMPSNYRPPFPAAVPNQGVQAVQSLGDPKSLASGGGEAAQVLGANELRLMAIVGSGGPEKLCQLWHHDVYEARHNIMRTFRHLLQNDLFFCAKFDVEFYVWKICFYNLVATLKTWLQGGTIPQAERQVVEENVIELLDEGFEFYSEMLDTLDKTYNIGLEQYFDVLEPRSTDKLIRCALVSAQKCLLCLGDLARYKEMIQNTSNYGKARQYYQKASHIDTRNAKPFNQLAILAWTAKRKFEAVYYHMRCLQTKTPVESSRQSLTEIFEDIRKRWEASEKKRLDERAQRKKEADSERDRNHLIKGTRLRKEIWIKPDGSGRRLHRTTSAQEGAPDSEEAELKEMSTTELNRRFNSAFLHLIGTLFTHINIDAFPIGCDLLQKEFRILLSRSPLPIDCKRLVQIMALNMFIIEHTKMKSGDNERYVSVTQNYALQLAFEMFGILVERCNDLMLSFIPALESTNSSSQSIFHDDDLPNLLSAVKVWCDWLLGNNDTWYPVLCDEPFNELAKLATHLEKLKPLIAPILQQCLSEDKYTCLPANDQADYEMIKLDEDAVLCGFAPWSLGLNWNLYRRYARRHFASNLLQDARRLDAINFCIDYLEGLEPPVLKWSPPDNAHISLVTNVASVNDRVNAKLTHMLSREQDILDESYSDDENSDNKKIIIESSSQDSLSIDRSSKIGQLKIRKEELERRRREAEETRKLQQEILSEHVSVTLEVSPKYIVPDTNCFVDFLPEISRLASSSNFQIRVPLVVLKELDGLAKGARPDKYSSPEYAAMVAENARQALSFLKDRPINTRCVTSKGSVVSSLGVTTEDSDYDSEKNNDDLILDACINLAMHREDIRGNMRVVSRDLVLLTDDRNLKLKAHTTDIPVNKLSDFIHWAYSA